MKQSKQLILGYLRRQCEDRPQCEAKTYLHKRRRQCEARSVNSLHYHRISQSYVKPKLDQLLAQHIDMSDR